MRQVHRARKRRFQQAHVPDAGLPPCSGELFLNVLQGRGGIDPNPSRHSPALASTAPPFLHDSACAFHLLLEIRVMWGDAIAIRRLGNVDLIPFPSLSARALLGQNDADRMPIWVSLRVNISRTPLRYNNCL